MRLLWRTPCHGRTPDNEGIHPTVIIGTPGRMSRPFEENFNATVVTLVIDEFLTSLEFGFHDEMAEVIGQLPSLKKRFFSRPPMQRKYRNLPGAGDSRLPVLPALMKLDFLAPKLLLRVCGCTRLFLRRRTSC